MEENNQLKVSVIVPVYKVEEYLERCVTSVINQAYKNLEIILIDDGSPDKSGKICDKLAKQDKRIKVVHKQNGGVSSARNEGLTLATGDFVTFLDSDDWFLNSFSECCEQLTLEDEIVITDIVDKVKLNVSENIQEKSKTEKIKAFFSNSCFGKFYSKKIYSHLKFDKNLTHAEDMFFVANAMAIAENYKYINNPFYYYFEYNEASAMHIESSKYVTKITTATKHVIENLQKQNYAEEVKNCLIEIFSSNVFGVLRHYSLSSKSERKELKPLIKQNLEIFSYTKNRSKKMVYKFLKIFGVSFTTALLSFLRKIKVVD